MSKTPYKPKKKHNAKKPGHKARHPYVIETEKRFPGEKVRWIKTIEQERELYAKLGI